MKTMDVRRTFRPVRIVLVAAAVSALAACGDSTGPACNNSAQTLTTDVQTRLSSGVYAGQAVATFHLTQLDPTVADVNCTNSGNVRLLISSNQSVTQSFTYTVEGLDANGGIAWSADGTVTQLAGGSTVDEGNIISTSVPIDQGIRVILNTWSSP
jgi:hypothetical protein